MKKKTVLIVGLVILVFILLFITMIPKMQTNMEFNLERFQFSYDFAKVYTDATETMRGMTTVEVAAYMAENDFRQYIQDMQEIIDDRILGLRKWEEKFNKVYSEPFYETETLVALEYAYHLSSTGFNIEAEFDDGEWSDLGFLFIRINLDVRHFPSIVNSCKKFIETPPLRMWLTLSDEDFTDYYDAHSTWEMLEKTATAYIEDTNIPDEKKQWIAEYIQSDPYGNMCRKLEEKGMPISKWVYIPEE